MEFVGCSVFVDCGSFGVYQGVVSSVDADTMSLTLNNVMKDGEFAQGAHVIHAAEICDIKVLKMGSTNDAPATPVRKSKTVAIKNKLAQEANAATSVPLKIEQAPCESPKIVKPSNQVPQNKTAENSSSNSNRIMQQLLIAPVSPSRQSSSNSTAESAQVSKPVLPDESKSSPLKQKENQKPKQNVMVPTAAFKILKRGEALPQQPKVSANGNQKIVADNKPNDSTTSTLPQQNLKDEKNQTSNKKKSSKKSESDKSEPCSENVKSSLDDASKFSATSESIASIVVDVEKPVSSGNATPTAQGIKMDPLHLISALSASSSSASVSPVKPDTSNKPKKILTQRSLSVNDQAVAKPQFEKFGDFKKFKEQQAPNPCNFRGSNNRSRGNTGSPSGVPHDDFKNGYGKVHRRNKDLDATIDHEAFKDDFDFSGNLALMVREEDEEGDDTDSFEPPAHIRNFRNDENILGDPSRVTSWTSSLHEFSHTSLVETGNGSKVPVLSVDEKTKLLEIANKTLGTSVFNALVADRLISVILDVISKNSLVINNIVVFGSPNCDYGLVNRLALALSNREFHAYFVNSPCRIPLPKIDYIYEDRLKNIVEDVQIVVMLEPDFPPKLELLFLNRVACGNSPAHIIAIDKEFSQYSKSHSLYLAALVEGKKGKYESQKYVAELGLPFSWFKCSDVLSQAFQSSTLISI